MAKVFGLHMIGLRPGVKAEDFERFFQEKVVPLPRYPGVKVALLKGERGDRVGKYLLMVEIESVETRNRFAPRPDEASEDAKRFNETHPEMQAVFKEWEKFASPVGAPTIYTDYVVVAE